MIYIIQLYINVLNYNCVYIQNNKYNFWQRYKCMIKTINAIEN